MKSIFYRNQKTAFTLIELLVVISVISLLLGI
ncbi:MAG: prepilin-type N-terminal cleavage/methylation domain-containing protein, partial [Planctomycetes bacterium]|nr:prepilin-type N-terminal cleavage/methylation domain-containing protein [Planctomycetota bacterium]